ncbi:hypothetical protein Pmani_019760 [Petrolisthes manimaculis]|uniref:ILEI/PANDER domain-containing protein n=1 Tax=Petrolisthes manimaculis TaxID=1843537 RepID=A0AAE1U725_9EUCA|nr:hypothetical protein Pmani_019760 [Petrolisthes manimaculis]
MSGLSFCRSNLSDCLGIKLPPLLLTVIMMAILLHVPTASSAAIINTTNTNTAAGDQALLLRLGDTGNKASEAPSIVAAAAAAEATTTTTVTTTSSLNVKATVTMLPERKTVTITASAEEETPSNIDEKVTTSLKEAIASPEEVIITTTTTTTTTTSSSSTTEATVPTEEPSVKATVPTSPQEATVTVSPREVRASPASDAPVSMNGGNTSKGEMSRESGVQIRTPNTADGNTVKASSNVGDIWKEHSNFISSSDDEGIVGGGGAMKLKSMALQIEPEEKYKKDDLELEMNAQNAHLLPTVKAIRSRREKTELSPERTQKTEPEQTVELETEPEQEIVPRDKDNPLTKLEQFIQHQHQRESSDQATEKTQEARHKRKQEPNTQEPSAGEVERAAASSSSSSSSTSSISHLLLDVSINTSGAMVLVNGIQVYQCVNKTVQWGSKARRYHAGLHLVVLHQYTGRLMAADSFTTWQMTSDTVFLSAFHNIQNGRLILILGAPDFTTFLGKEVMEELEWFGSNYISNMAYKDVWCLVLYKGGGVMAEAVTTYFVEDDPRSFDLDSSHLTLQLAVLPTQEPQCSWYNLPQLTQRATFCRSYEGYGHFCRCDRLPWSPRPLRHSPQKDEVIPVAIVTGGRLPQVLRQVDQIRASPGGDTTPIVIVVDGTNMEAISLANLLQVTVTFNTNNTAPRGTNSRINIHIRFTLITVFKMFPEVDKIIVLEDDLELSPDFISYFQQTARLLSSDPSLFCVNAYNYNAFPHTALDPSRLYRIGGLPAYGWMVRRTVAQEMVNDWPPVELNLDWDLWVRARVLQGREIIVPEVPRTKHVGSGGVHVTGLEQALYHGQRTLNTRPNVTLDLHGVFLLVVVVLSRAERDRYLKTHWNNIRSGRVVRLTTHPCQDLPLPTTKCLGMNDRNSHEHLRMMYTSSFYGNQVYLIGCPTSSFCLTTNEADLYHASDQDVMMANNNPFRKVMVETHIAIRLPPLSFSELVDLENLEDYYYRQV